MAQRHSSDDPTSSGVIIGVDPHQASHTAAALGTRRQVLAHLRVSGASRAAPRSTGGPPTEFAARQALRPGGTSM